MSQTLYAHVDENGHIVLPPGLAHKLGLLPGDEIRVMSTGASVRLRSSITTLRRVYVEVTNQCNLNCSTCMRNVGVRSMGRPWVKRKSALSHRPGVLRESDTFF